MPPSLSLYLVEDERRFRDPFAALLATTDAFDLTQAFEQYEELSAYLDLVPPPPLPDLVVMDLVLPGTSGLDALRDLKRRYPGLPAVVLTSLDDPVSVVEALEAGARGYVVKGTRPDAMLMALREAHAGGTYFSPSVARHVLGQFAPAPTPEASLTDREVEVLRGLAQGRTKADIAEMLYLSPHTVDNHMRAVYRKLHAKNAAEAAAKGVRSGLI